MPDIRKLGNTSNIVRFRLVNSSTGQGLTGLSSASTGLIISTIADNEATATTYTVAGSTIESITTLGTFATPTATKCRFKEVDATNHKGLYEFQFDNARFAVASSRRLVISVTGATNLLDAAYEIELVSFDPFDSVRLGLTALPNAAAGATNGLPLAVDNSGRVDVLKINGTSQTARDIGASVLVAGDLSATMKTSVQTAADAAITANATIGVIDTDVIAIKAKTDLIPASPAAVGSAMTLTSGERDSVADALLDRADAVESGVTPRQGLRGIFAAETGIVAGAGTGTVTISAGGTGNSGTTRITATVDSNGNRTSITYNL